MGRNRILDIVDGVRNRHEAKQVEESNSKTAILTNTAFHIRVSELCTSTHLIKHMRKSKAQVVTEFSQDHIAESHVAESSLTSGTLAVNPLFKT